jgi:mxaK protein
MRRVTVHAAFAIAALAIGGLVIVQAVDLARALRIEAAIAHGASPAADDLGMRHPEGRLARILALSVAGRYDEALAAGTALAARAPAALRPTVLYDLGNLHLHRALATAGSADAAGARAPLVELAKARYRDALRLDPDDWDARYNLERALSLAPEADDDAQEEAEPSVRKERTVTTAPVGRSDLP